MMRGGGERKFCGSNPFTSYLDHDHCKRENVRFLTICSLLGQNLWGSPSRGMTLISRCAPHGIQVLSDRRETKIRDPCVAGVIHKDVWLGTCQYGRKAELISITHSFEITMNYVAGVEKVKTFGDIR